VSAEGKRSMMMRNKERVNQTSGWQRRRSASVIQRSPDEVEASQQKCEGDDAG